VTHESWKPKIAHIGKVIAYAEGRLAPEDAKTIGVFIALYYANASPDDVLEIPVETLYGAALSAWKLMTTRLPGAVNIQILNPNLSEHGWSSAHTVIQIVNDDMPFLVDSVSNALSYLKHKVHLVIHPTLYACRDEAGRLIRVLDRTIEGAEQDAKKLGGKLESIMHIEIDEQSDPKVLAEIEKRLRGVLADVRLSVEDWRSILGRLEAVVDGLAQSPPPLDKPEIDETVDFLKWLGDNNFTFLGYREYEHVGKRGGETVKAVEGSGLGILRDPDRHVLESAEELAVLSPEVRDFLQLPELMIITKANVRATVHRSVHMDYVSVKRLDAKGRLKGEHRFVGLFTSAAYNLSPRAIPFLRRKVRHMLERANFLPASHDGKALLNVLETFPRDELFQIDEETLFDTSIGVLRLQERPRAKVFLRYDKFERYISTLAYVPREVYNTDLRVKVGEILCAAFDGAISAHYAWVGESALARIHFIVKTRPGAVPAVDVAAVNEQIAEAARSWGDRLRDALIAKLGEAQGNRIWNRFASAFSPGYCDTFSPDLALFDIERIEKLKTDGDVSFNFYRPIEDPASQLRLKIYHAGSLIPLSDCLPMLEHVGLKVLGEQAFEVTTDGGGEHWVHDFRMEDRDGGEIQLGDCRARLEATLERVWSGEVDDDGFNALVLKAGLDWRQTAILRAYFAYQRQIGLTFSPAYVQETLTRNPEVAALLVELFLLRFDPDLDTMSEDRAAPVDRTAKTIEGLLEKVSSLDEDRILRRYLNSVLSTLRTNYFQRDDRGEPKPQLSFKLDSSMVDDMPLPRPHVEIFVYSPRVEGIHLRDGKVARGGLRWSDRREDFRTEILGLKKAQRVKNTVIVPVGAKGGFVPKRLPSSSDREAMLAEGIACYKIFVSSLLDLTDNIVKGEIVRPVRVVRHDEDDPYLVVAADKGTASFSDIANGVAKEHGFWLGDAFASGGSAGYDHKKMGITARGAWISVQRHFREIGIDVQQTPIRVVGIGDMSGDVFGNGMLMSRQLKLVAAFDHRHVFIDPDPDPMESYIERERLFSLPRSSWADYKPELISKGGGIFPRSAKSIALTPEMKAMLGVEHDKLTPAELIKAVLLAEADLLWVGGIGTYCKAHDETHAEAGDRANDPVRIDGRDLRFKVVGEGGNLGFTQCGRIEYARHGGRINSDAIDNSAGVDCSDHEVNIKILLNAVVADGEMTEKQRDRQLAEMTDEVAQAVLADNYFQTQVLSVTETQGAKLLQRQIRYIRALERAEILDRAVEFLPDDEALAEIVNDHQALTRPELAVLLAYSKMDLFETLQRSDAPDDPALRPDLARYFPAPLREKFTAAIDGHRLKREITAAVIANEIINQGGPTFVYRIQEESGADYGEIARAFVATREAFKLPALWGAIHALDNKIPASIQYLMLMDIIELLQRSTLWFLRNCEQPIDIERTVAAFLPGIEELSRNADAILTPSQVELFNERAATYGEQGVPAETARLIACLEPQASAADIVRVANELGREVGDVGRAYFALGARLGYDWLRTAGEQITTDDHWERLAVAGIVDDLYSQQRALTKSILTTRPQDGAAAVEDWALARARPIERALSLIAEYKAGGAVTVGKLGFAARHFHGLLTG
jgi:glutamate dehydrogenase